MGQAAGVKRRRRRKNVGCVRKKKSVLKQRHKNVLKGTDVNACLKMEWDPCKNQFDNFRSMGLSLNPNQTIGGDGKKKKRRGKMVSKVVSALEQESKKREPRNVRFSIPEEKWVTKMLDKHGEDCCAISRDADNLDQLTPSQIKNKIKLFKAATDQWAHYLKRRGLLQSAEEITPMET